MGRVTSQSRYYLIGFYNDGGHFKIRLRSLAFRGLQVRAASGGCSSKAFK